MPSEPKLSPRCQDEGILGTVTGVVGTLIANEIFELLPITNHNYLIISWDYKF